MSKYEPLEMTSSLLTIHSERVGPVTVLAAAGEIDISSSDDLQRGFEAACADGASEIWLDLSRTTFIDCGGLRSLLELHAGLLADERRLVLICPSGPVRRLLHLTAADDMFDIQSPTPGAGV